MLRQALLEVQSENQFLEAAKSHGVTMKVVDCRGFNRKGMALLLELGGPPARIHSAVMAIRHMTGVRHVEESEPRRNPTSLLAIVNIPEICRASRDQPILCLECPFNSESETMHWRFVFQKPGDLRQIMENLNHMGVRTRLRDLAPIDERPALTIRQAQVINTAIKQGYYEFPRGITLTELSHLLGVEPSTFSEILRSAERRILQNTAHFPADLNRDREAGRLWIDGGKDVDSER